ncbi:MAG: CHAD domain-containing protein [Ginsengibacter sp.]
MKQREIYIVVNKRFKKTGRFFSELISEFEIEPIHDFRTEIKKLRAFLRLLNVETGDDRLKISKEMKIFYGFAGTIRNLQLQLKNICDYPGNPGYAVIPAYIDYLKKIIEKRKENVIEFTGSKNNFTNDQKKIIKQLPGKSGKGSAKKFLQNKMNELVYLITELPDDDVLHGIRKLLKDILYNWAFIKQYSRLLPPDFADEEKIKSFTELIGLFLDKRMGIILLETYCKDCEENGFFFEKDTRELQEIEGAWEKEKEELAGIIYIKTGLLQIPAVDHAH